MLQRKGHTGFIEHAPGVRILSIHDTSQHALLREWRLFVTLPPHTAVFKVRITKLIEDEGLFFLDMVEDFRHFSRTRSHFFGVDNIQIRALC